MRRQFPGRCRPRTACHTLVGRLFVVAWAALWLTACGGSSGGGNAGETGSKAAAAGTVTLKRISVTPADATVPQGLTAQFEALGVFSDGIRRDITASAAWTSDATSVSTIDDHGRAAALAAGTAAITATLDGVSATKTLTVSDAALAPLRLHPPTPPFPRGSISSSPPRAF